MPTPWIVSVMFVATLVQCTFGFGNALLAMPLLALIAVPLPFASPLVAMISMSVTVMIVIADWRHMEFGAAGRLVAGAVFGIPFGLWLLVKGDDRIVKGVLALVIFSFSTFSLIHPRRLHLRDDRWGFGFGWIAGILGGAYNTHGPPLVIFGFLREWSAKQFRATLQGYFLLAGTLVLAGHAAGGLWTDEVIGHYFYCLPLAVSAFFLGSFLSQKVPPERFQRAVHYAILLIALSLFINVLIGSKSGS
jgi:uncharacterized protein